ncbi:MAG: DUF4290 domain-containing protein, partial [Bacteroidota bacterium]
PLTLRTKPERLSYREKDIPFRHYGKNVMLIIEKAIQFEEGPEKDALVKLIAIHLKKSYLNWNRESVTDELIEDHLKLLSGGKLKFHEDIRLTTTSDLLARNKPRKPFRPKTNNNNNLKPRKKIQ